MLLGGFKASQLWQLLNLQRFRGEITWRVPKGKSISYHWLWYTWIKANTVFLCLRNTVRHIYIYLGAIAVLPSTSLPHSVCWCNIVQPIGLPTHKRTTQLVEQFYSIINLACHSVSVTKHAQPKSASRTFILGTQQLQLVTGSRPVTNRINATQVSYFLRHAHWNM